MKKFFAHLKIKQDIKRGKLCQNALVLERAKKMSLAAKFATELTSLVVETDGGSFRSGVSADGGSSNGPAGMCSPTSPGENSGDSGPCNISLYSKESYRGDSLTFSSSMPDLSVWDFEEKLASVKVEGTCQWKIFTGEKNNNLFLPLYFFVQTNLTPVSRRSSHRLRLIGRRKV